MHMQLWTKVTKPFLEWLGIADTLYTIGQAEFIRTLFWPVVVTVSTAISGFMGGVPVMWVFTASALAFMGTAQGLLRGSEYLERKNPLNKLIYRGTHVAVELEPADVPFAGNRKQRLAHAAQKAPPVTLGPNEVRIGIRRTMKLAQVAVSLRNNATFPISVILHDAKTEVAGETPPRSKFPRKPSLMQPGTVFRITDDPIEMDGTPCGRLEGKLDMTIKYGLPGREKFELHLIADLDVHMEEFGYVVQVASQWKSEG